MWVGAADGFVEGGDGVVVLVPCAIVDERFGEGGFDGVSGGGGAFGEVHGEFEEVEGSAGVAIGEGGEVGEERGVD